MGAKEDLLLLPIKIAFEFTGSREPALSRANFGSNPTCQMLEVMTIGEVASMRYEDLPTTTLKACKESKKARDGQMKFMVITVLESLGVLAELNDDNPNPTNPSYTSQAAAITILGLASMASKKLERFIHKKPVSITFGELFINDIVKGRAGVLEGRAYNGS